MNPCPLVKFLYLAGLVFRCAYRLMPETEQRQRQRQSMALTSVCGSAKLSKEFWKFLSFMRPQRFLTLWPFLIVEDFRDFNL
ncbi:MAG: hypothetical protein C4526_02970 [Nitrospiraceae bacterium]|nr:MAG: hypothetical protein C4526_02970 [Nitrospiraceae bacterium]